MRYQKVMVRIWNDKKFRKLPSRDSRLFFLYLLTSPHSNALGAFVLKIGYGSDDADYTREEVERELKILSANKMIKYDRENDFLFMVHYLDYNPPGNPNQIINLQRILEELPPCILRDEVEKKMQSVSKPFPNEPRRVPKSDSESVSDSDTDKRKKHTPKKPAPGKAKELKKKIKAMQEAIQKEFDGNKEFYLTKYPGIDFELKVESLKNWVEENPTKALKRKNMNLFLQNCFSRERPRFSREKLFRSVNSGMRITEEKGREKAPIEDRIRGLKARIEELEKPSTGLNEEKRQSMLAGVRKRLQELEEIKSKGEES